MVFCLTYLHFGYVLQAVNSPNRPFFSTRLLPHCGHFSSSGTSDFFCVPPICLVVLQSGYPEQA